MSLPKKNNLHFSSDGTRTYTAVNGLDDFANSLEKDFFADVRLHLNYCPKTGSNNLIVDICCNFGIAESFHYFNNGSWGGFECSKDGSKTNSSFGQAFKELKQANYGNIDIKETSLHFKDTSIIIAKLWDYSIPDHFGSIIFKASEHFVYLTKGLTEMPYEIFVPVFEDKKPTILELDKDGNNYYNYWGVYFENDAQHDVMVYNLNTKQLRKEDFFLLE